MYSIHLLLLLVHGSALCARRAWYQSVPHSKCGQRFVVVAAATTAGCEREAISNKIIMILGIVIHARRIWEKRRSIHTRAPAHIAFIEKREERKSSELVSEQAHRPKVDRIDNQVARRTYTLSWFAHSRIRVVAVCWTAILFRRAPCSNFVQLVKRQCSE